MKRLAPYVLFEDNHLLVINKPAMLPTMGVEPGRQSLLRLAKEYIKQKYHKPGNVYLGVVSRLDAPVSGVVVFARTSKAAARLTKQYRLNQVEKTYWAVVSGSPDPPRGHCVDWLRKDEPNRRMCTTSSSHPEAQQARLEYQALQSLGSLSLLQIRLETGRKHQIRVQLAKRGCPIVGDRKYGSREPFARGIALHARRVSLEHPVRRTQVDCAAPLPDAWRCFKILRGD